MKKFRGKPNPTRTNRAFEALAKNFYTDTPMWRFVARGGRGRRLMILYRRLKGSRRPQCFRQDVW
jgi:hypothetical protein